MVGHDETVPGVDIRVKGPPPRRPSSLNGGASSAAQQEFQGQGQGQAHLLAPPQPSGPWPVACTEAGGSAAGAGSQPAVVCPYSEAQAPPCQGEQRDEQRGSAAAAGQEGGVAAGASGILPPPWQQLPMPGVYPHGLHAGHVTAAALPPWAWGPPLALAAHPAAGGPPGWVSVAPFQPMQQLPALASMPAPLYMPQPPLLPPLWGPSAPHPQGAVLAGGPPGQPLLPPGWQHHHHLLQQQDDPSQGPSSIAPGQGPPWQSMPVPYAVQPLSRAPSLQRQFAQQHPNPSALAAAWPALSGMPVWETRSVLSMRDSIQDSR